MLAEIFVLRLEAQLRAQERAALSEKNVFALFGRDLSAYFDPYVEVPRPPGLNKLTTGFSHL